MVCHHHPGMDKQIALSADGQDFRQTMRRLWGGVSGFYEMRRGMMDECRELGTLTKVFMGV